MPGPLRLAPLAAGLLGTHAVAGLAGWAWAWPPRGPCRAAVASADREVLRGPNRAGAVRLAPLAPAGRDGEGDRAALLAGLDACGRELARHVERDERVRTPWPEDPGIEAPDEWKHRVEQALRGCDLGVRLAAVDCTEYPCSAVLVGDPEGETPTEERLTEALGACPQRGEYEGPAVIAIQNDCDRSRGFALVALAGPGEAAAAYDDVLEDRRFRWMMRRADDLQVAWGCPAGADADEPLRPDLGG